MRNKVKMASIPERPDVLKVVLTPAKLTLLNRDAAEDAKIIWLMQNLENDFPAPILLR